jgi:hypothetical protein
MGYLRRGKWIRDERFVSWRGESVCAKLLERHLCSGCYVLFVFQSVWTDDGFV